MCRFSSIPGADASLLHPGDGVRISVDFTKLGRKTSKSVGIGGATANYAERAVLAFSQAEVAVFIYEIDLTIAEPAPGIMDLPSLLGRDILDRWLMIYDPSASRLLFQVLATDFTVPIA